MVLDCFAILNDVELTDSERKLACLLVFIQDFNTLEDVLSISEDELALLINNIFLFFNCGQSDTGPRMNYRVIDWEQDSQLISAAVNKVAGKEIRAEQYIHWWTFMGYFNTIGEGALSTIVGIRNKIARGKPLEKHERVFRMENPQYFNWDMRTLQQKEDDELLNQIWNRGE